LDYNSHNANTSTHSTDEVLHYLRAKKLILHYVLETHAHADHLTSAAYIRKKTKAQVAIGTQIQSVQETFKEIFNFDDSLQIDGSQFDTLLKEGDEIALGQCQIKVMHTPGHTNDSMAFICGDCVFIGDTLFSPDYGSARCDFPGGNAEKLFDSVQKIYALGDGMKLYLCHDYPPNNRKALAWFLSSVQQSDNKHIKLSTKKQDFVQMRQQRDVQLNQPKLIIPSIQVNIRAGNFPQSESNGKIYLKIPINILGKV
jgi:glyoxylase-like metal-dependent hydrolase (beta-lactamase superfamily II)